MTSLVGSRLKPLFGRMTSSLPSVNTSRNSNRFSSVSISTEKDEAWRMCSWISPCTSTSVKEVASCFCRTTLPFPETCSPPKKWQEERLTMDRTRARKRTLICFVLYCDAGEPVRLQVNGRIPHSAQTKLTRIYSHFLLFYQPTDPGEPKPLLIHYFYTP